MSLSSANFYESPKIFDDLKTGSLGEKKNITNTTLPWGYKYRLILLFLDQFLAKICFV